MNEQDYEELFETAQALFNEGKYNQSESILNQLILKNQKKPLIFHLLGTIYYDRGKFNKAIRAFKRALEIDPAFTDASVGLSIILNDLGKYEEGRKVFEEAQVMLASRNKEQDSYVNEKLSIKHDELGELYFQHQRYTEALEQYLKSLMLSGRKAELNIKVVQCLIAMDELSKAETRLRDTIQQFPKFIQARTLLGEILHKKGSPFEANREWNRVLQIEPENKKARQLLNDHNQLNQNL